MAWLWVAFHDHDVDRLSIGGGDCFVWAQVVEWERERPCCVEDGGNGGEVKASGTQSQADNKTMLRRLSQTVQQRSRSSPSQCTWPGGVMEASARDSQTEMRRKSQTHHVVSGRHCSAASRHIVPSTIIITSRDHCCSSHSSRVTNVGWVACRVRHAAAYVVRSRGTGIVSRRIVGRAVPATPGASMARIDYLLSIAHAILYAGLGSVSGSVFETHLELGIWG